MRGPSRTDGEGRSVTLDLGITLIDAAEMYGQGGADRVAGEAIAERRDEVFLGSKVYLLPWCRARGLPVEDDVAALDRAFPPPRRKVPLAVR